jgi:ABC-type transport system substrate-binding protein
VALVALGVVTVATSFVAIGASQASVASNTTHAGAIITNKPITIGSITPPGELNPATTTNGGNMYAIGQAVYDSLITVDPKTGVFKPDLATSWRWSKNHLELFLTLRKGVTFQDGTPFDAAAVAWFENYYLKEGDDEGDLAYVTKVTSSGPYTVVFHCKAPFSELVGNLTVLPGFVGSPTAIKKEGSLSFGLHPVGAGPYEFVSQEANSNVVLKAWPGYWNNAHMPRVNDLTWQFFSTDQALVSALKSGTVDAGVVLNSSDAGVFAHYKGLTLSTAPLVNDPSGIFLTNSKPFSSVLVRLAFNEALDDNALGKVSSPGFYSPDDASPPGIANYIPKSLEPIWPYDPTNAKKLLAQAGYPKGFNVLCYIFPPISFFTAAEPVMAAELKQVGINATFEPATPKLLNEIIAGTSPGKCSVNASGNNDTSIWGIEHSLGNQVWSKGVEDFGHTNFGYDKYIDQINRTFTDAGQKKIFTEIMRREKTDPTEQFNLWTTPEVNVYKSNIAGYASNGFNDDLWQAMYWTS